MLIVLDANHVSESISYGPNSVISVDSDIGAGLVTASKARAIVAGPVAWSAASFAANNLVIYNGTYYVNSSAAVAGDVPGAAVKWVSVSYLTGASSVGSSTGIAGYAFDEAGVNKYPIVAVPNADNVMVVALGQTPIP